MIPQELKKLIDKYCTGMQPSDEHMDEIMDMMISLNADPEETTEYMQQCIEKPLVKELHEEEKPRSVNYEVILDKCGPTALLMVKAIIDITGLPLGKAKALIDNTPSMVLTTNNKEKAEEALALLLSKNGQAHIKKIYIKTLAELDCQEYDFSEYDNYDTDSLIKEAERLMDFGDMENAHKGVALFEHIANSLVSKIDNTNDLECLLNYLSALKNFAILCHMPNEAAMAIMNLKDLANKNCDFAFYALFIAYSKGYGTSVDTDLAAQCAKWCIENSEADIDSLTINAYCYLKGWGLDGPDKISAREMVGNIISLKLENPDHSFEKHGQEIYDELLQDYQSNQLLETMDSRYYTPESIVDEIINNMVGGFENINVFSKNDKYMVCKYLVTQKEWEVLMGENPSWEKSPNFPVVNITYAEAEEFVDRVNKIARGKGYQFMIPPTDWQWLGYQKRCSEEFKHLDKDIVRAGVSMFAWHDANSGVHLHDVGKLQPTAGIYDAAGLVYEMGQIKKYTSYRYGAFNEPLKYCFGDKSSDLMYADKRYDNLGLRLICMEG